MDMLGMTACAARPNLQGVNYAIQTGQIEGGCDFLPWHWRIARWMYWFWFEDI